MAGKPGRSGRRSWDKELESRKLWDLSIPVLKHALTSEEIRFEKKVDVALALVNKMMPQQLEGKGFENQTYIFNNIKEAIEYANNGGYRNTSIQNIDSSRKLEE